MDVTPILIIFRMIASEFNGISDGEVIQWIELTAPLVSKKRFGNLYNQALAFLTAHRIKMNPHTESEEDPISDLGKIGIGNLMRLSNYSEGETSIGFNNNIAQYNATDAEFALTQYGIQFLNLRRMRIMPIISAGEVHGRV